MRSPRPLLALASLAALNLSPGPDRATSPSSIAFASRRDGNLEIYRMDADGRAQTRLTSRSGENRFPVWSPDGRRIAFGSSNGTRWELWVMDAGGGHPIRLVTGIVAKSPRSWSPDGTRIACVSGNMRDTSIVLSVEVSRMFPLTQSIPDFSVDALQQHATRVSHLAKRILGHEPGGDVLMVAGLLQDSGQLVLASRAAPRFASVYSARRKMYATLAWIAKALTMVPSIS